MSTKRTTKETVKVEVKKAPRKRKAKEPTPFAGKFGALIPSNEVVLTDAEREFFIQGIQESSSLLSRARLVLMKRSRVEMPRLAIGDRAVKVPTSPYVPPEDRWPDPLVLTSSKFIIPLSITEEFIQAETDWRPAVLKALTNFAATDLEDAALNGDENHGRDELLLSNDGWLIQARRRRRFTLGRSRIRKGDVLKALGGVEARFRDDEKLIVLMSTLSFKRLGDIAPYGIEPWVSAFMPDNAVFVTHRDNLILGLESNMKLRQTTEGKVAIENDERYFAGHVRLDFLLENTSAACVVRLVSVPDLIAAAYSRFRQRLSIAWRKLRYPEVKRRLWNLQTAIALGAGFLGGSFVELLRGL